MKIFSPISISLSPNAEKDDILLALKLLFQPWQWKITENCSLQFEEEFKKYLGVKYAVSFNSGRAALLAILDALGIKEDDPASADSASAATAGKEILIQGFTCNSAVVPILAKKAKPVFVDVDETINMNPEDLRKKISKKSKAVIIQHNFGWPAEIEQLSKIARENNLCLIEDCAHALGAKFNGKFCGTFGDAAFFSFGRDKIISSIFGGMAITNNEKIGKLLKSFQEKLDFPPSFWIFQQLLHPILMNYLILPAFGLNQYLGRIILGFLHKLSILSKAVYKKEKRGELPKYFPKKFPNALTILAKNQFRKLERFNSHRRELANFYERELKNTGFNLPLAKNQEDRTPVFMRYPILTKKNTDEILGEARKRKIYLDDGWRKTPIVPSDTDITKMNYNLGNCPRAEKIAQNIIDLPTHINISQEDAKRIVDFLKNYG